MKDYSRIKFNPNTKEIEVEGSEEFVKAYFDKLQALISGSSGKSAAKKKEKAVKASPGKRVRKIAKKSPSKKKESNYDKVLSIIQSAGEGISTADLIGKTGLSVTQIRNVISRASKEGKIWKVKRGVYGMAISSEQVPLT